MSKNIYQKIERGEVSICQTCIHRLVCRAIDNQPCTECNHYQNATDVAQVVRCKDCIYHSGVFTGQPNIICFQMKDDDFCSYGARMDKEDEHEADRC